MIVVTTLETLILLYLDLIQWSKANSLRYLGPTIWAKLDSYIWSSETLSIFNKRIKHVNISSLIGQDCDNCYLCEN